MPPPRAQAGVRSGLELVAGRWAPAVDGAGHLLADAARERGAARRRMVGAAQAAGAGGDGLGQAARHAAAFGFALHDREIDAEAGAAGATGLAVEGRQGMGHGSIAQVHGHEAPEDGQGRRLGARRQGDEAEVGAIVEGRVDGQLHQAAGGCDTNLQSIN